MSFFLIITPTYSLIRIVTVQLQSDIFMFIPYRIKDIILNIVSISRREEWSCFFIHPENKYSPSVFLLENLWQIITWMTTHQQCQIYKLFFSNSYNLINRVIFTMTFHKWTYMISAVMYCISYCIDWSLSVVFVYFDKYK